MAAPVKRVNRSQAARQPMSEDNEKRTEPCQSNKNDKHKQNVKMVRQNSTIPVQRTMGAILVPEMTTEAQQELEAARVFVENHRTKEQDQIDRKDISMAAEYSDEIFEHLRSCEEKLKLTASYAAHQPKGFWDARSGLMDWLVTVHADYRLVHETLFLAVNYFDRYLSRNEVKDLKMKLIGAASLLIATKYEDDDLDHEELVHYLVEKADGAFDKSKLLETEVLMLKSLNYALGWPDAMSFLHRISRANVHKRNPGALSKYFLYITVVDKHFVSCIPSFLAAGAYCLSQLMLEKNDWVHLCLL
jgi:G2/mitotic-specific cyclin 3/4